MILTSADITCHVMDYLAFQRHMKTVAFEVEGYGNTRQDIVAGNEKEVWEVEIKADKHDFAKDFDSKKAKHDAYMSRIDGQTILKKQADLLVIPNKLYFAVGTELQKEVESVLSGTPYGILLVNPLDKDNLVRAIKPAVKLHNQYPKTLLDRAALRCRNGMIMLYRENLRYG